MKKYTEPKILILGDLEESPLCSSQPGEHHHHRWDDWDDWDDHRPEPKPDPHFYNTYNNFEDDI